MRELLYVVAFVLLAIGATMGDRMDRADIVGRPRNPFPLRVVTGTAGLLGVAWFIYGFFPFSWWIPLVAVASAAILGAYVGYHALRSGFAPLTAMASSVAGVVTAVGVVVAGG